MIDMIVSFKNIGKFCTDRNVHWLDNKNGDIPLDVFLILLLAFVCYIRYSKINCEEIELRSYDVHIDNTVCIFKNVSPHCPSLYI